MIISLMFLTGVIARIAVSNTVKAAVAAAAWVYKAGWDRLRRAEAAPESKAQGRRHPHQVMRWENLEVGREYTSVHVRECDGRMFEYQRTFAGVFRDLPEESQLPPKGADHHTDMRFTVHPGGQHFDGSSSGKPSYLLWGGDNKPNSYGSVTYLLGEDDMADQHQLLVPTDQWQGDPRVAVDWDEERPSGGMGEMVWMYDTLRHKQLAAVISGPAHGATAGSGEPVYYVTFIRGGEIGGGSCNLQRRSKLTVRRDLLAVDELWRKKCL